MRVVRATVVLLAFMVAWLTPQQKQEAPTKKKSVLSSKLDANRKRISAYRSKIRKIRYKQDQVLGEIKTAQEELEEIQYRLKVTTQQLGVVRTNLGVARNDLENAKAQLSRHYAAVSARIVAAYEGEPEQVLTFLFDSNDPLEFVSRSYYVGQVAEADMTALRDYRAARDAVENRKRRLEGLQRQYIALRARHEKDRAQELDVKWRKEQIFQDLARDRKLAEEALRQMEEENRMIEAQIRRLSATAKGQLRQLKPWGGSFISPVNGPLSSGFGMRFHPILKVWKMHTGLDFSAPQGTPIRAAAGGEVIISERLRGYGKTVIVDHGGGIQTLYGHCSEILVAVGQTVKQGQVIARVGSTGLSTGPHLHWEKRVRGVPVNP